MNKALSPRHSDLFMVRLWWEGLDDGHGEWRGKVQHVARGDLAYFRDWFTLIDFLITMSSDSESPDTKHT
jgi:hypothetical protein